MTVSYDFDNNFNKRALRGCDFDVLPFLRVFPPAPIGWARKKLTLHMGWLAWTLILHFHFRANSSLREPPKYE
jgi:hypothetical protein